MFMTIIAGIVMVIAFVGMLFCAKLQRSRPNAKFMAIALLLVVLACGGVILKQQLGEGDIQGIIENEMKYSKAAAVTLGQYLGKKYPQANPLIIASHDYKNNKRQKMLIDGIKEGMKKSAVVVDCLTIKKDPSMPDDMAPMMEEMMTAKQFNEVTDKNAGCDLVISTIGLPQDVSKMKVWKEENRKAAILFGEVYFLKNAIKGGKIVGVVTFKPGIKFDEAACPDDIKAAFDKRYVLITPETVDKIAKEHSGLFSDK